MKLSLKISLVLLLFNVFTLFAQQEQSDYGLTLAEPGSDKEFAPYTNHLMVLGNAYSIEGNEVVLKYHDIQLLKTIFKDVNDGIAIDIIKKSQFNCGNENSLSSSKLYDGFLLKPVYRDELFASNSAKGDYRFVGKIGVIPNELLNEELVYSLLIINNGKVTKYLMPALFTSRDYLPKSIPFRFENTDTVQLLSAGVTATEVVKYSFNSSKIIPVKNPTVSVKGQIHSIEITAFSSIDGELVTNRFLDSSRTEYIAVDLQKRLKVNPQLISKQHGENWSLANYQFRYFDRDSLLTWSKENVRKLVNDHQLKSLPMDSLLRQQRICEARIYYSETYLKTADSSEILKGNLLHAVATKNSSLFNKAAFGIYQLKKIDPVIYDRSIFSFALENSDVVAAYAALLSQDVSRNQQDITRFLLEWSQKYNTLSPEAKENLVNLYCLLNRSLLKDWDVESSKMARVIRPKTFSESVKMVHNKEVLLNLNLTYIKYYGQINDTKNAQVCFNYIARHFSGTALNVESAVQLAAFYNSWGSFQLASDLLGTYYVIDLLNEDGMFLYAQNQLLLQPKGLEQVDVQSLQWALKMNKERWCKWMSDYTQNLRNPEIKKMYCASCSGR